MTTEPTLAERFNAAVTKLNEHLTTLVMKYYTHVFETINKLFEDDEE